MSARAVLLVSTLLATTAFAGLAHAAEAEEEAEAGTTVSALTVEGERLGRSAGATGLELTLRETPQSVTQVSAQQIDDFALTNVNELLAMVTGVNVERVETDRTYFNARGFDITNFQVDGVGLPLVWGIQFGDLDTAMFERVDIVRGANGMLTGAGNPSATVNYIRKRPTEDRQATLSASYGSWDALRLQADLSGPLNASGTVKGRLVYAYEDRDSHLDFNHVNRDVLYGVLSWDVTPRLNATVGYSRQDNQSDGVLWGSLPLVYSDGTRIRYDRSASTSTDWTYWDVLDESVFVEGRYAFGNGWRGRASYTHRTFEEEARLLYAFGNPDPVTGLGVMGMSGVYPSSNEQDLFDLSLTGPLTAFGRTHELVLGYSHAEGEGRQSENFSAVFPVYPAVQDWGRAQVAQPAYPGAYLAADRGDKLKRVYGAVHLNFSDRLKGVAGFNAIDLSSSGVSYVADQTRSESKVSPYVGLVFDLTANLSLYGSYTDIFNPQSEVDINRDRLDAAEGRGVEVGLKSEWLGGRLYATVAAFTSEQAGLAEWSGTFPGGQSYHTGVDTFVEGYELEIAGAITDRWQVSGGWTHLSVEDEAGDDARLYLPRKTFKLAATYRVPRLRNLKLGGAIRWQSEVSTQDLVVVEQGAYAVVDAMASFDVTERVRATINVKNLFDETYLTSLMWSQSYHAAPRGAAVRLDVSF